MSQQTAYRSDDVVLLARRHELLEKREAVRADVETLVGLQAAQSTRTLAGLLGLIGTVVALGAYLSLYVVGNGSSDRLFSLEPPGAQGLLTLGVFFVPGVTLLGLAVGRLLRPASLRASAHRFVSPTQDLRSDVERLESGADVIALHERLLARAGKSFALPFAILALFAPLMLHFLVFFGFSAFESKHAAQRVLETFDSWVILSFGLMALSYLVLIIRVFGFAARARTVATQDLARTGTGYGFATLGLTSLAACVPGAVLFFIPPVISFLTGVAILPAMFAGYGALIRRERVAIETAFSNVVLS